MLKKILLGVLGLIVVVAAGFGIKIARTTTVRQLREASSLVANGKAERTRTADALDYSVATTINAPPEAIWSILTDSAAYPTWNTTVVKIEGPIAMGSKLALTAKVAPGRVFPLAVTAFEAPHRMVWEDGNKVFMGVRTFTLTPAQGGGTTFAMQETLSGAMLGMIEGSLPDFTPDFQTFAADLKKTAESRSVTAAK